MSGDRTGGFTIFYADDGLDTGPILLQKETTIDLNDTVDTFYNRFLYPEGKLETSEFKLTLEIRLLVFFVHPHFKFFPLCLV